ncbi:MAG TPA: hypothetical protein VM491_10325, partial [Burkholderiaceae bacterium]|nr:hypothetical protein [Burkholderiaceae bacterium]
AEPVAPSTEQPIPHAPPAAASTPGPRQQPTQPPPAERGAAAPARAAAAQVAVRVNVRPWGEVVVNGVARGVSPPLTEVALAPGRHLIEFRNPAAPPKRIELTLRNGQPVTLSHQFQERTP